MKKIANILTIGLILTLPLFSTGQNVPPPPDNHGESDNQPAGNGAPIGGGMFILIGLGTAYGGKKYYDYRKRLKNEMED